MGKKVTLSESELHNIISETVNKILKEMEDNYSSKKDLNEAWYDSFGFLGKKAKKGANKAYQSAKTGVNNVYQSAKNGVNNAYQSVKDGYQNYKDNMQQYSQSQDKIRQNSKNVKVINNMISELQNFKQSGVITDQFTNKAIDQLITYLKSGISNYNSLSGAHQERADYLVNNRR